MKFFLRKFILFCFFIVTTSSYALQPGQQPVSLGQEVRWQQAILAHEAEQIKELSARVDHLTQQLSSKKVIKSKQTKHAPHSVIHAAHVQITTIYPSQQTILDQSTNNTGTQPVIVIGNKKEQLLVYGKISPMFFTASDGQDTNAFFASNNAANSALNVDTFFQPSKNWQLGSNLELDFDVNVSNVVSQTTPNPGQSVDVNKAEIYLISKQLGGVSFGIGKAASGDTAYSDFSETALVSRATMADIGGGLFFRDKTTGVLSAITVGNAINGLDGLPNNMRIRYDTPRFYGFSLAGSALEGDQQDIALKFGHMLGAVKVAAQVAYTTTQDINSGTAVTPVQGDELNGSAAILFPVGINFSAAYGTLLVNQTGRDDPNYFYVKPGYRAKIFHVGDTAMSVDMGRYYNFIQNSDHATAYGVQLLQTINPWSLLLYLGYSNFSLKSPSSSFDNINLFIAGALYKF